MEIPEKVIWTLVAVVMHLVEADTLLQAELASVLVVGDTVNLVEVDSLLQAELASVVVVGDVVNLVEADSLLQVELASVLVAGDVVGPHAAAPDGGQPDSHLWEQQVQVSHLVVPVSAGRIVVVAIEAEEEQVLRASVIVGDAVVPPRKAVAAADGQFDSHHWEQQMVMPYMVVLALVHVSAACTVMEAEVELHLEAPSHVVVLVLAGGIVMFVMDAEVAPACTHHEYGTLLVEVGVEVGVEVATIVVAVVTKTMEELIRPAVENCQVGQQEFHDLKAVGWKQKKQSNLHTHVYVSRLEESSSAVGWKEKQQTYQEESHLPE